jgi:GAF domain-containing protein
MADNLTPQDLAFPLAILLGYVLLVTIVVARRGLRRREPGIFVSYLVVAAGWFLCVTQSGLLVVWPVVPWERLATYVLIGLGVVFWDFTRAFLQKPFLPIGGWLSAAVAAGVLIALDTGVVTVPPLSLTIGVVTFAEEMLTTPFLSASVVVVYTGIAVVSALAEHVRRPSPLHRNRIKYWLLGTAALVAGPALVWVRHLVWTRRGVLEIAGTSIHWLGAALIVYVVVQPQLPDIATGVRSVLSYLFAALIPVAIAVGLSLGLVYLLGWSLLFRLQLSQDLVFGMAIAGVIVFVLYQPLSSLTRRGVNRLLFGRGYGAQRVVREYSQAISQIMSLEELTATAMDIIDGALGIQRGTLLVVEERRETQWQLRVIEGLHVPADQPPLILEDNTPLSDWLVKQGAPLHQYTMDVDPQFETLSATDREAWRRLGMEVFFPVGRSGALIGLMALGLRRSGRPYTDPDLGLLATLADQTAVALENASLFDRVQRRAEQLALLNEIGRVITSSLDLEPAVDLIAERIETAFKAAAGFIFLLDEPRGELVLQSAFGREAPEVDSFRVQLGQGLVGWGAAEGEPVLVSDLSGDSRYAPAVEGVLASGAKSALCVPVIARGKTIGVILVVDPARTSLGSMDLNLLDSIASFASIAIENARRVAAREAKLRRQVEELRIQIDEIKRAQEVEAITDSDYFRQLQAEARRIRRGRAAGGEGGDV